MTPETTDKPKKPVEHMRHIVLPFLSFRIWFHWLDGKRSHMYGQEWNCTISQVEHSRVKYIELDKEAGYIDCLGLAEKYNRRYHTAKIYSGSNGVFNKIHRIYRKGSIEPEDINDPVFNNENRILLLSYKIESKIIRVEKFIPPSGIDFKKEIDDKLSKK